MVENLTAILLFRVSKLFFECAIGRIDAKDLALVEPVEPSRVLQLIRSGRDSCHAYGIPRLYVDFPDFLVPSGIVQHNFRIFARPIVDRNSP